MEDYEEEQWMEHPVYVNYVISSEGRVYSHFTNKILNGINQNGDIRYTIRINNSKRNISGCDLVLDTFYQNYNNDGKIIIKNNGNVWDNSLNNLVWIDKNLFLNNPPKESEEKVEVEISGELKWVPVWKKLENHPEYRISYDGKLFSCCIGSKKRFSNAWIELNLTKSLGYFKFNFYNGGKRKQKKIHQLVLEAYVGKAPKRCVGCHKDGNSLNNHISNLRWDSQRNNVHDTYLLGRTTFGEKSHFARLTESIVKEIHILKESGFKKREIMDKFKISNHNYHAIISGRTWNYLHPTMAGKIKNGRLITT